MLVAGPILMLVGSSYVSDATTDSRGLALTSFKQDVSQWTSTDRAAFSGQSYSMKLPTDGTSRPLRETTAGDSKIATATADIGSQQQDGDTTWATWEPLLYQASVSVPAGDNSAGRANPGSPLELHTAAGGSGSAWSDYGALVGCQTVTVSVTPCSNTCSNSNSGSSRRRSSSNNNNCHTCSSKCNDAGGQMQGGSSSQNCVKHVTLSEVNLVMRSSSSFEGIAYSV